MTKKPYSPPKLRELTATEVEDLRTRAPNLFDDIKLPVVNSNRDYHYTLPFEIANRDKK